MKWCLFACVALLFCSCEPQPQSTEAHTFQGELDGETYTNARLGFELGIPSAWRVIPMDELKGRGEAKLEDLREKISDLDTRRQAFEPFLGLEPFVSEDSSYVTLLFMADNLEGIASVNNGYDYFNQQAAQVSGSSPDQFPRYEFSEISQNQLGGRQALAQGTVIHASPEEIQPMLSYSVQCGGNLMVVQIANFDSPEELNQARDLLDKLVWTSK